MDFTPLNVTLAILGISLLVIVHEAGHFLAARAFGMRVLRFSIGLGPALWKHQSKNSPTIYQVCAIPLLAYVQIDGMNPTETIDPKDPTLYPNKGVFARIITIFAGPFANYLAASLMVFCLLQVGGWPDVRRTTAATAVMEDTPAAAAGLQPGDRVIEVEGRAVADGEALIAANEGRGGRATRYVVMRGDERLELTITPTEQDGRALLGIQLGAERVYETVSLGEAATQSLLKPWEITVQTFEGIAAMFEAPNPADNVKSVVGMTAMLADSIKIAPQLYVGLLIHLSVALGLFNLLPIPALDGGRLVFLGYELVTRRRANEKVEAVIHTVGLLCLLGLLALVMVKDVIDLT